MESDEVKRFKHLYLRHLNFLKLQGNENQQLMHIPGLSIESAAISNVARTGCGV
ncbi:MAG: hypothetical protein Q7U64_01120 [Desulfocapsaceae bacterium]|jgi:hypothetical protein|nr:hypothetical protein [Desulfocapsaceae bacterium]